ncbi:MAG: hypothetical protein ABGZ53_33265 [Fuerstiella sp.]
MKQETIASNNAAYLLRSGGQLHVCGFVIAVLGLIRLFFWSWDSTLGQLLLASSMLVTMLSVVTLYAGTIEAKAEHSHSQLVDTASTVLTVFGVAFMTTLAYLALMKIDLGWLTFLPGVMSLLFAVGCSIFALFQSCRLSASSS